MADAAPERAAVRGTAKAGSGRRVIFLIAVLSLAPIVAAFVVYYYFPRQPAANYGTLLPTAPVPPISGIRVDGSPFGLDELRGRWVLLWSDAGACGPPCEKDAYATRQARTMQGKDQDRIARVLLLAADAPAALVAQHPDLIVVRVAPGALASLPGGSGTLLVIDPLGNLVLRYPSDPDIRGIANDLTRLLKASRIG